MKNKIKAVVLDVDGVIIGNKVGVNTPNPNIEVIEALGELKKRGFIVSFCTSKPYLGVEKAVRGLNLLNLHITDGGAVLFDALSNKAIETFAISSQYAKGLIQNYIGQGYYVAIYTPTNYMIQKSQKSDITDKHAFVLQRNPVIVDDLASESLKHNIIKIVIIAKNEADKEKPDSMFKTLYAEKLNIKWGQPQIIKPLQFGTITDKAISKGKMLLKMMKRCGINRDEVLSVGNSDSDWNFMRETDYVATLENGQNGLKTLVNLAGSRGFVSKSVDENGFIDILNHFELISPCYI